jgi:anti-sigma regulatory factor (Ser/Thr protein kinase)
MVELQIGALPAHVRTARLIAAAVARRCGVDDAVIDEVKLAVGEACSRAVSLHAEHAPTEPVVLELRESGNEFEVAVVDIGPADDLREMSADDAAALVESSLRMAGDGSDPAQEPLPSHLGLALIAGLVDRMSVDREGDRTAVRMRWLLAADA